MEHCFSNPPLPVSSVIFVTVFFLKLSPPLASVMSGSLLVLPLSPSSFLTVPSPSLFWILFLILNFLKVLPLALFSSLYILSLGSFIRSCGISHSHLLTNLKSTSLFRYLAHEMTQLYCPIDTSY